MFGENAFTYKEIIKKTIYYFGHTLQKVVAIEELSELQKALTKSIRYEETRKTEAYTNKEIRIREDIIEELADVQICIDQIMEMFEIDADEIAEEKANKIKRLNDRINALIQEAKAANGLDL